MQPNFRSIFSHGYDGYLGTPGKYHFAANNPISPGRLQVRKVPGSFLDRTCLASNLLWHHTLSLFRPSLLTFCAPRTLDFASLAWILDMESIVGVESSGPVNIFHQDVFGAAPLDSRQKSSDDDDDEA